jgi:hypothetical protein
MRPKRTWEERLWEKLDVGGDDECWVWKAGVNGAGMPILSRGPSDPPGTIVVARFVYEFFIEAVGDDQQLNNDCGNRRCCNPAHQVLTARGKHLHTAPQGAKAMTLEQKLDSLAIRLPAMTEIRGPNECHEFRGYIDDAGYGRIGFGRALVKAHQAAWMVEHRQEIPEGKVIRHLCKPIPNRKCCNLAHLKLGTHKENMEDKMAAGRGGYEKRTFENAPRGSAHHHAKMTEEMALEILSRHANHEMVHVLAKEFGLSIPTVSRLVNGHIWRHLKR